MNIINSTTQIAILASIQEQFLKDGTEKGKVMNVKFNSTEFIENTGITNKENIILVDDSNNNIEGFKAQGFQAVLNPTNIHALANRPVGVTYTNSKDKVFEELNKIVHKAEAYLASLNPDLVKDASTTSALMSEFKVKQPTSPTLKPAALHTEPAVQTQKSNHPPLPTTPSPSEPPSMTRSILTPADPPHRDGERSNKRPK